LTSVPKAIHYAVPQQINNFLRELPTLASDTDPTIGEVMQYIRRAEGMIDLKTQYGFREKRHQERLRFPEHEFTSNRRHGDTLWFDGVKIPLVYRGVKDLDADKGDAISVRQGSSFVNYLTSKTEGLNADYFMDNENGVLHLYRRWVIQMDAKVICSYRYGDARETLLDGIHNDTVTTLTVDSTEGFEPNGLLFGAHDNSGTIQYEVMYYNQASLTEFQGVARGQEESTALTYADDEPIWQVPEDINEAAILYTAIQIAENHALSVNTSLGDGMDYIDMGERVEKWQRRFNDIVNARQEWPRV
jgi:hypothetical protein